MGQNDERDAQLWEFIYGLLPAEEAEALRRRIASDPDVARAYARVKLQSEIVAAAARWQGPPVSLLRPSDERVSLAARPEQPASRSPGSRARLAANGLVGLAAAALLCVLGYGYARPLLRQGAPPQALDAQTVVAELSVPDRLYPGLTQSLAVRTLANDGTPQAAQVGYRIRTADGSVRLAGQQMTDSQGQLHIAIPASLVSTASRVEIDMGAGHISGTLRVELRQAVIPRVAHLMLDRPCYRPGETVAFRSVTLSRADRRADAEGLVEYDIRHANGNSVLPARLTCTTQHGVGSGSWRIPPDSAAGVYTVVVSGVGRDVAGARQTFVVQADGPAAAQSKKGPPAAPRLVARFVPEGGELVAGLKNRVYFECRDQFGRPLEVAGRVTDSRGGEIVKVRTRHAGRGVFEFVPRSGQTYALHADEPLGGPAALPLPPVSSSRNVMLRVEPSVLDEAAAVPVEIYSKGSQPGRLLVAAHCRGAMVGQRLVDGRQFVPQGTTSYCRVSLPVAVEADGVLRVSVFDCQSRPPVRISQRLVYRRPRTRLNVRAENLQPQYAPGEKVQLALRTTDETGRPVSAVLGVGVVADTSPQADPGHPLRLPEFLYLAAEIGRPEDLEAGGSFGTDEPAARESLELLLGLQSAPPQIGLPSQQWLAQPNRLQQEQAAAGGPAAIADGMLRPGESDSAASGGRQDERSLVVPRDADAYPVICDNRAQVEAAYAHARATWEERARVRRERLGCLLSLGGAVLAVAVLLLVLLRLSANPRLWVPALATACVSLAIGIMWLGGVAEPPKTVAVAPRVSPAAPLGAPSSEPVSAATQVEQRQRAQEPPAAEALPRLAAGPQADKAAAERRRATTEEEALKSPGSAGEVAGRAAAPLPTRLSEAKETAMRREESAEPPVSLGLAGRYSPGRQATPAVPAEPPAGAMPRAAGPAGGLDGPRDVIGPIEHADDGLSRERSASELEAGRKAVKVLVPSLGAARRAPAVSRPGGTMEKSLGEYQLRDSGALFPDPRLSRERRGESLWDGLRASQPLQPATEGTAAPQEAKKKPQQTAAGRIETLLWKPLLVTGEDGRAGIEFTIPDWAADVHLFADAHADGRVGAVEHVIRVRPTAVDRPD